MHNRWNIRRISIWTFLIMQLILVVVYFSQINETPTNQHNPKLNSIQFIQTAINTNKTRTQVKYYNEKNTIVLASKHVEDLYEDFNTSLCYKPGTDVSSMKRHKNINWKCLCLENWHGVDCGQPEVIWRALLAAKKPLNVSGPRKVQRRLIYYAEVRPTTADFIEIVLSELTLAVDLFIVHDADAIIAHKLNSGFLRDIHSKILYLTGANASIWKKLKHAVRNLRTDDIFFISRQFEIPNIRALMFLKLYDGWPQPLVFRLRWSVYGFFWRHPQRTVLSVGAYTIGYFEAQGLQFKFISNKIPKQGFIIGDLNHYGGWFCEYCADPSTILKILDAGKILVKLDKRIDVAYVEDLIENGLYVDGKMELHRAHRYNDNYYAPVFVNNNSWKFDWLLGNLYSKMDYY